MDLDIFRCSQVVPGDTVAGRKFEQALMDMQCNAFDSRGLKILLFRGSSYSASALREAVRNFSKDFMMYDRIEYRNIGGDPDPLGELSYARNLQLLMNAYVAALEYEATIPSG